MKHSDCTSMIHQTAPPPPPPPLQLQLSPLSVEGIIRSRQGLHKHATSYNWNEKRGRAEEMLYQGSGESGIGVQTAIQQCQPRKWAAGCTRTSLGHSLATGGGTRRGSVRKATWRRGRNNFRVGIRPCEEDRSEVSETLQLQLP